MSKEVTDEGVLHVINYSLQLFPFNFLGPVTRVQVLHVWTTPMKNLYKVNLEYGGFSLNGLMFLQDPDIQLYLDFHSTIIIQHCMIDNALSALNRRQGHWSSLYDTGKSNVV